MEGIVIHAIRAALSGLVNLMTATSIANLTQLKWLTFFHSQSSTTPHFYIIIMEQTAIVSVQVHRDVGNC